MTEAAQAPNTPAPEAAEDSQETQTQEQTFTQKDLNKIVGQRAKEAEQRAINSLLERAGAESIDDVLAAYSEYSEIQEAVTTEADRANERAERLEKRAKAAEERYTNTLREFALRDSLRDAGINPERLRGAMRLADLSALEVDKEGNVTGLEDVVAAVREEAPEFFGEGQGQRGRSQRVDAPQTNGGARVTSEATDPQQTHAQFLMNLLGQAP